MFSRNARKRCFSSKQMIVTCQEANYIFGHTFNRGCNTVDIKYDELPDEKDAWVHFKISCGPSMQVLTPKAASQH